MTIKKPRPCSKLIHTPVSYVTAGGNPDDVIAAGRESPSETHWLGLGLALGLELGIAAGKVPLKHNGGNPVGLGLALGLELGLAGGKSLK